MQQFFSQATDQAVLGISLAMILTVVGWYFLKNYRDQIASHNGPNDHLLHFRELQREGVLDESEFRTIKTVLGQHARGPHDITQDKGTSTR